jgi:hypothetical protein
LGEDALGVAGNDIAARKAGAGTEIFFLIRVSRRPRPVKVNPFQVSALVYFDKIRPRQKAASPETFNAPLADVGPA